MSALDMSVLCRDWTPSVTDRELVASMPLDKELTLSLSLASVYSGRAGEPHSKLPHGVEEGDARTLILSAFVDEIVLFELRFWDGRLRLNAGTGEAQDGCTILGADDFDFQVSFNPLQGGLAIVASWVAIEGRGTQQFVANISNLKLPPARYYTLRLGAPKRFVDLSLLGWLVNATYDLAPPVSSFPPDLLEFVPAEDQSPEERELLADLFLGYNPATERVVRREPGYLLVAPLASTPTLAETSPLDTLRLALQSIDSWRKVAEDALHVLEGGAR